MHIDSLLRRLENYSNNNTSENIVVESIESDSSLCKLDLPEGISITLLEHKNIITLIDSGNPEIFYNENENLLLTGPGTIELHFIYPEDTPAIIGSHDFTS